jgi:hypothetical protein
LTHPSFAFPPLALPPPPTPLPFARPAGPPLPAGADVVYTYDHDHGYDHGYDHDHGYADAYADQPGPVLPVFFYDTPGLTSYRSSVPYFVLGPPDDHAHVSPRDGGFPGFVTGLDLPTYVMPTPTPTPTMTSIDVDINAQLVTYDDGPGRFRLHHRQLSRLDTTSSCTDQTTRLTVGKSSIASSSSPSLIDTAVDWENRQLGKTRCCG